MDRVIDQEPMEDVAECQNPPPLFPLLKLPFLAQEQIIQSMEPSVIYLITLTFPRFLRMIKWRKTSKVKPMLLEFNDENQEISVRFFGRPGTVVAFSNLPADDVERELWNFDGKWLGMRTVPSSTIIRFHYRLTTRQILTQHLLDHFVQAFAITTTTLKATVSQISNFFPITLKNLTNLELTSSLYHPANREPIENIDELLGTVAPSSFLCINTNTKGFLRLDSKLLSLPTVVTGAHHQSWLTIEHLKCFGGKHLIISRAWLTAENILDFVDEWLVDENGIFEDLEFLRVMSGAWFNEEKVEQGLEEVILPEEEGRRARSYKSTYPFPIADSAEFYDCSTALDIERPSDGRLASIKFTITTFSFFVWNNRFP